jgi:hypothetical protein
MQMMSGAVRHHGGTTAKIGGVRILQGCFYSHYYAFKTHSYDISDIKNIAGSFVLFHNVLPIGYQKQSLSEVG